MKIRTIIRRALRTAAHRLPVLKRLGGKFGIGRLVAPTNTREQILLDGDVRIELDLSVPIFRYLYFQYDLSAAPEISLLKRVLSGREVCVDVGAHIGYLALVAAKYAAKVIAFEPSAATFEELQRNMRLNPALALKVDARMVGISDRQGDLDLFRSGANPDLASLSSIAASDVVAESVRVDTLDHAIQDRDVAFIKIDI